MNIQAAVPVKLEHGARMDLATFEEVYNAMLEEWPRYELHNGVVVELPPPEHDHNISGSFLIEYLGRYLGDNPIGIAYYEVGVKALGESKNNYFIADIAYFSFARFPKRTDGRRYYGVGSPDIVVEIDSPGKEIAFKVSDYLKGGSRLVWVIYPKARQIYIYRADGTYLILDGQGVLDGSDVLPGFQLDLATFWERVERAE